MGTIKIRYKGCDKISGIITVNNYASVFSKIGMSGNYLIVYMETVSLFRKNRISMIYDLSRFDLIMEVDFNK